jgi:hypothetical protein
MICSDLICYALAAMYLHNNLCSEANYLKFMHKAKFDFELHLFYRLLYTYMYLAWSISDLYILANSSHTI